jgi:hypothetical protein
MDGFLVVKMVAYRVLTKFHSMENTVIQKNYEVTFEEQTLEELIENFARSMVDVFGGPVGSILIGTFFPDNSE